MGWDNVAEKFLDLMAWLLRRRKKKAGDAFVDYSEVTAIVRRLVHDSPELRIKRALVIRAHNGLKGKRLMPIGYKYVSVLANDWREPFCDVRTSYQELPLDDAYVEMITGIYLRKDVELIADQMTPGMLRDLYAQERVASSHLFFLNHNEEEFWFLSLATDEPKGICREEAHRAAVYVAVNRIRKIVKPYFK